MRTAFGIGGAASGRSGEFESVVNFAVEAEKLGVDVAWSAEAWGYDAVAPLAYLATLSPKALELTGELADGWLGTSFTPEHAEAHLEPIARGASRAGRSLDDIEIAVGGSVGFGDDVEGMVAGLKPRLAFTLGAMGSAQTNFYNDAFRRGGFEDAAIEVQKLWLEGKREEAARRVPDEMVMQTTLLGSEAMVRERIRKYRDAGVNQLRLDPLGKSASARLEPLGRVVELVREECGD